MSSLPGSDTLDRPASGAVSRSVADGFSSPSVLDRLARRWPILAVGAVYVGVAIAAVLVRSPLGHDESVYALRARDLSGGWSHLSGPYFGDYRAPGLPIILNVVNRVLPEHVSVERMVVVALGLIVIVATWALARLLHGELAGISAAALLVVTSGITGTSTMLLADIPGAAFALLAVLVFVAELQRGALRWSFLAVPALGFIATVCRFGAPITLGAGLIAGAIVLAPAFLRSGRWMAAAKLSALAVVTGLACAVVVRTPMLSIGDRSPSEAHSGLGSDGPKVWPFGDLRDVVNPWSNGPLHAWSEPVAIAMAIGLAAGIIAAVRTGRHRPAVVFGLIGGAVSIAGLLRSVGLIVPNYLALSLPYWAIAAGVGWATILRWVFDTRGRLRTIAIAGVVGVAIVLVGSATVDVVRLQRRNNVYRSIASASETAGRELGDGCILISSYTPQVGYYSGCRVNRFEPPFERPPEEILRESIDDVAPSPPAGEFDSPLGVLVVEGGKRQPDLSDPQGVIFGSRMVEFGMTGGGIFHVWVDEIAPCVASNEPCEADPV